MDECGKRSVMEKLHKNDISVIIYIRINDIVLKKKWDEDNTNNNEKIIFLY